MADERLQKVLARAGIASRRAAEELITKGRVKVDGRVVDELGVRVDPRRAKIEVDGNRLLAEPLVYIVLHKPRGVMCTMSDPEGRPTVAELLKAVGVRVVPVGRLDFHTSGALLFSNDGDFANALAHPRNKAKKVYVAKVQGLVIDDKLDEWRKSIDIDGRATAPADVRRLRFEGDKTWLEITLREGRNRQVRRLGESTGSLVMRLARISHAGITAEDLRPGQWRHLSVDELVALKQEFGVPVRVRAPGTEAWEVQVKANAKVPRVGISKRGDKPVRERREAPSDARPRRESSERREAPSDARPRRESSERREAPSDARPRREPSERREAPFDSRAGRPSRAQGVERKGRDHASDERASRARAPQTHGKAAPEVRGRSERRPERREGRADTRNQPRSDSPGGTAGARLRAARRASRCSVRKVGAPTPRARQRPGLVRIGSTHDQAMLVQNASAPLRGTQQRGRGEGRLSSRGGRASSRRRGT